MASVRVEKLIKKYGDFTAVKGMDLTVEDGEFMVFLGPSGCGKTTTLRCIAGLEIPDEVGNSVAVKASDSGVIRADEGFWIAVLPFKYAGDNADLTALAEGLSEGFPFPPIELLSQNCPPPSNNRRASQTKSPSPQLSEFQQGLFAKLRDRFRG